MLELGVFQQDSSSDPCCTVLTHLPMSKKANIQVLVYCAILGNRCAYLNADQSPSNVSAFTPRGPLDDVSCTADMYSSSWLCGRGA